MAVPELIQDAKRLAGNYLHRDIVAYQDDVMKTMIVTYGLVTLVSDGDQLMSRVRFCHVDVVTDQDISIDNPNEMTQAIVPIDAELEISGKVGALGLRRAPTPTGIGIKLADPINDPLPTDPNDPRISDDDGDGKPGVTIRINVAGALSGELYIARREIFEYRLNELGDGRLGGHVVDSSEQLVLGASDEIFNVAAQWRQVDDPSKSPIVWIPDAEGLSCDQLEARRFEIFGPAPIVDY